MPLTYLLETGRLRLRTFTLSDAEFIICLLNSPGWLQFIGNRQVHTTADAERFIQEGLIKSYEVNGYGLWLVEKKEDGNPIGMCGLVNRSYLDGIDIGFAFLPQFSGKGYAFEIASATINYAKETLHIPVIYAITLAENAKSIRLLEKMGLQFVKTIFPPNNNEALQLYSNSSKNARM